MKLLAERVIDRVPGVVDIHNEVRVDHSTAGTGFAPVGTNSTGNRRSQETQTHRTS